MFIIGILTSPSSNGELIRLVQLRTMVLIVNIDDPRLKLRRTLQLIQKQNVSLTWTHHFHSINPLSLNSRRQQVTTFYTEKLQYTLSKIIQAVT
jgi:hypothetical protein